MEFNLIIAIASVIPLALGISLWQKGNNLLMNGKKTDAIVFKNNYRRGLSGVGLYYPVVRFLTEDDEWITQKLDIGQITAMEEGSTVQVIYHQENPYEVEINSTIRLEILPRMFVIIGVMLLVLGLLGYLEIIDLHFTDE